MTRHYLLGAVLRQAGLKLPTATDSAEWRLAHHVQLAVEHPRVADRLGDGQQVVEDARASEDLQCRRLQRCGPCLMMGLGRALEDARLDAMAGKFMGREQAGRPRAYDHDLGRRKRHHWSGSSSRGGKLG